MNDRLKFRVWDKENNCLHYPSRYHNYSIVNGTIVKIESYPTANSAYLGKRIAWEFDDAVIMQCTGLKDKNGKLIYENDFVKNFDNRVYQVIWINDAACFMVENIKRKAKQGIYSLISLKNDLEVIGNIYENKELLNENS